MPLTIRLTVQPIFLFSVSSPFMQSLGGRAQMSVPWLKGVPLGRHAELPCYRGVSVTKPQTGMPSPDDNRTASSWPTPRAQRSLSH